MKIAAHTLFIRNIPMRSKSNHQPNFINYVKVEQRSNQLMALKYARDFYLESFIKIQLIFSRQFLENANERKTLITFARAPVVLKKKQHLNV